MMKLDLKKIDPFPMTVPCLDGVGSCDYDICQIIRDMGATVCDHFPEGQPCDCPLLQVSQCLIFMSDYQNDCSGRNGPAGY